MTFDWRAILGLYQRLSARERVLVGGAAGVLLVVVLYALVWEPLEEARAQTARRIRARQQDLVEIQRMRSTYHDLLRQYEAAKEILCQPTSQFSLFPYIESTVTQVLVDRSKIVSMNPQTKLISNAYREESIEVKLTGISLQQLVDMMYRIEVAKGACPLRVTRLLAKKQTRDKYSFDVTATVSMLQEVPAS
jgi:type II secretory pathway component PulM